jgi:hypothetical protein
MATNVFKHSAGSPLTSTTPYIELVPPVPIGVTSLVFYGTFANIDNTGMSTHWFTLARKNSDGTTSTLLNKIPIPWGATSKCPKVVLMPGESLLAYADADNCVQGQVEYLERS